MLEIMGVISNACNADGNLERRHDNGYKRRPATPLMPQQANQPPPEGYQLRNYRIASVLSCGVFHRLPCLR
jgi:hypothetical protein